MIKKLIAAFVIMLLLAGIAVFVYRYRIVQYSAEKIVRGMLPGYLQVERMEFDVKANTIRAGGVRIANPRGFSSHPMIEVGSILCRYRLNTANLLDGITITELRVADPVLRIERRRDGAINIYETKDLTADTGASPRRDQPKGKGPGAGAFGGKKPSELLRLPDAIDVERGEIRFTDDTFSGAPRTLTFNDIAGTVSLSLNDSYTRVLSVRSEGSGTVNAHPGEEVAWVVSLNPTTERLTMSNRFRVTRVEIVPFEPYFDRYSPVTIEAGLFSGDLVFDFSDGSIGSTNTVRLEDLRFSIKKGYENAPFLQASVPDLIKYFQTQSGAIVFDFKIKGDMSRPQFYLGPITKQALAAMAVDKIGEAISAASKGGGEGPDMERAQAVIDMIRNIAQ